MSRMVIASLRRRAGRAVALLLGVLVATTGFTVLTGSTEASRLQATGAVAEHARGSYDILVRPAGARAEVEQERALVRPNFLGGQYGGITADQWRRIAGLPGVEVAAPIAMLGYAASATGVEVDITGAVDRSATRQLIEVRPRWHADRGLTEAEDAVSALAYVTTRPLVWPAETVETGPDGAAEEVEYTDGVHRPGSLECFPNSYYRGLPYEVQPDGEALPVCPPMADRGPDPEDGADPDGADHDGGRALPVVARLNPDGTFTGTFTDRPGEVSDALTVPVTIPMPLLVAAIDPPAEAALVGLDEAVAAGRYLAAEEPPLPFQPPASFPDLTGGPMAPALVARQPAVDEQVSLAAAPVGTDDEAAIAGLRDDAVAELVSGLPPAATTWTSAPVDVGDGFQPELWDGPDGAEGNPVSWNTIRQIDPIAYEQAADGALNPRPHPPAAEGWDRHDPGGPLSESMPWLARDAGFREVRPLWGPDVFGNLDQFPITVGIFDPARVGGQEGLGRVPLETYVAASAEGGDGESRRLLDDQPLLPNTNPGGYLTTSPSVLLALDTVLHSVAEPLSPGRPDPRPPRSGDAEDPAAEPDLISAVRVRVAGVSGFDDVSRERVRVAAEEIATATGLEVDIVFGSSPAPQEIGLPAGEFGRPELRLTEEWSLKGVALAIIEAVDRKSMVLFGLILVVCALFVANASAAAVRDRRRELAVLACLGWSRWRLAATIAGEVAAVGLTAGALATAAAPSLGRLTGVDVSIGRAWLAVPVALGLALLASAVPAWRASRAHPGAAVAPAAVPPSRRARHRRGVLGMAAGNLWRVPGRTTLGVVALAVGVGGSTLLVAVTWAFHGTVTGSLLGDAVSVRVRGADAVAVAATLLLGLVAVADVLYVGVRERASELAALRATGWSEAALGRLVTFEGLGIGVLGAMLGAGAGLAGAAWFAGALPAELVVTAAAVAAAGVVLAGLAALVPAALQRRIPVAMLLAQE